MGAMGTLRARATRRLVYCIARNRRIRFAGECVEGDQLHIDDEATTGITAPATAEGSGSSSLRRRSIIVSAHEALLECAVVGITTATD